MSTFFMIAMLVLLMGSCYARPGRVGLRMFYPDSGFNNQWAYYNTYKYEIHDPLATPDFYVPESISYIPMYQ